MTGKSPGGVYSASSPRNRENTPEDLETYFSFQVNSSPLMDI